MSERVLIVRLSAIGDIVHTMPTAVAIKRAHPDWHLDWVVQSNMKELLEGHRSVDRVLDISKRPSNGELRALRLRLREQDYAFALDMQGLFKSARIVRLAKAKRKLGYHWQREFSWLFTKAVRPRSEGLHVVDQYLAVAEAMGCQPEQVDFGLTPQRYAVQKAETLLGDLRLDGRPLAMNLGAGKPEKRWPLRRFAEFADLARGLGWAPFVVGGPMDVSTYEEFRGICGGRVPSVAGKTGLAELVAVLSLCAAHVGGDTGSMHIAVALGTPVIAIMGPTNPERSGPYWQREHTLYLGPKRIADITAEQAAEILQSI